MILKLLEITESDGKTEVYHMVWYTDIVRHLLYDSGLVGYGKLDKPCQSVAFILHSMFVGGSVSHVFQKPIIFNRGLIIYNLCFFYL